MIELAGQQQDLTTIPLQDGAKLANSVASEIDYSQGTARRELMRHVREIQAITAELAPVLASLDALKQATTTSKTTTSTGTTTGNTQGSQP